MRESMIEWIFSLVFLRTTFVCVSLQKSAILSPCMCVYVCSLIDKFQHDDTISGGGRVLLLLKK